MSELVWYASYGSNLLRRRFMTYIKGGKAPGARFGQVGCTDKTPPRQESGVMILHPLFFAHASAQWEDLAIAFIGGERREEAKTLGRMYLISEEQFREVVLQENGIRQMEFDVGIDLEKTIQDGRSTIRRGLYSTLLHLGEEEGYPIFTFTAPWKEGLAPLNRPGPNYLKVIARGLQETYGLSDEGVVDYLKEVEGVRGMIPEEELGEIVTGTYD